MSAKNNLLNASPPWGHPQKWREANQCFDYLITYHQSKLSQAKEYAYEIKNLYEFLFPILDELCLKTCPECSDPCCLKAKVWFDFKDLLFLHLANCPIPVRQLIPNKQTVCTYLGHQGCLLPRISRPWVCLWYLCSPQIELLDKTLPLTRNNFKRKVKKIKNLRKEMEIHFINSIIN